MAERNAALAVSFSPTAARRSRKWRQLSEQGAPGGRDHRQRVRRWADPPRRGLRLRGGIHGFVSLAVNDGVIDRRWRSASARSGAHGGRKGERQGRGARLSRPREGTRSHPPLQGSRPSRGRLCGFVLLSICISGTTSSSESRTTHWPALSGSLGQVVELVSLSKRPGHSCIHRGTGRHGNLQQWRPVPAMLAKVVVEFCVSGSCGWGSRRTGTSCCFRFFWKPW